MVWAETKREHHAPRGNWWFCTTPPPQPGPSRRRSKPLRTLAMLNDPKSGILADGLTREEACRKILEQSPPHRAGRVVRHSRPPWILG